MYTKGQRNSDQPIDEKRLTMVVYTNGFENIKLNVENIVSQLYNFKSKNGK